MTSSSPVVRPSLWALLFSIAAIPAAFALDPWREVTPEERDQRGPKVDPSYGAETLLLEKRVSQVTGSSYDLIGTASVYQRIKVFNEAGVDLITPFRAYYRKGERLTKIEARTIKPDGTIIELDSDTVYESELERGHDSRLRAKAFTFPQLEPGDIVDLRFDIRLERNRNGTSMGFHDFLPAQHIKFSFSPAYVDVLPGWGVRMSAFQFPEAKLDAKGKYYVFEKWNTPAEADEDFGLPELHREPFIWLYYIWNQTPRQETFWRDVAREAFKEGKKNFKGDGAVQAKAEELTRDADSDREKLERLYAFCVTEIGNTDIDFGRFTDSEVDEMKKGDDASETLKRGYGNADGVRHLFGAMASGLGFDARLAKAPDQRELHFDPVMKVPFALEKTLVAVKVDREWLYLNPGNPTLPFGYADWWCAGNPGLIGDKNDEFSTIPQPPAEFCKLERKGELLLAEDGSLSGELEILGHGYIGARMRMDLEDLSADEREKFAKDLVDENLPAAELSEARIENLRDPNQPLTLRLKVKLEGYADVLGDRLIIQPAFFQKGETAIFEATERQTMIVFPFPWSEEDSVRIVPPAGYVFESGNAPKPLVLEKVMSYEPKLGMSKSDGAIVLRRQFAMQRSSIPAKAYQPLQAVFSEIHKGDNVALTFKKAEPIAETSSL